GVPRIVHALEQEATHGVFTVERDTGDDLLLPGTAASGTGFVVMDGGSVAAPGPLRHTIACARTDATHLRLTLDAAPTSPSASGLLFHPYGTTRIGHGNAVIDNCSGNAKPSGGDIGADLGSAWNLILPLTAILAPIVISDPH